VASYTGLNFHQVGDLDFVQYLSYRRDAYIFYLEQTEDGREYLDNAWRMEQVKPDREAIREQIREEKTNGR
jgi:hypothetical protein